MKIRAGSTVRSAVMRVVATSLYAAFVAVGCTPSAREPASREARIEWLQQNAIPIRSLDPADEDFSDLEALREVFDNARVVMLGEQSHGDAPVFLAKTRLIKFLHEKMGYDILAFESGMYDCWKAYDLVRAGEDPVESIRSGIFGIWTRSEQLLPLMDYIGAQSKLDRPLVLTGFDSQFTGSASQNFLLADLIAFLSSQGIDTMGVSGWPEFRSTMDGLIQGAQYQENDKPTPDARVRVLAVLDAIETRVDALPESDDVAFWSQMLKSIRANATWIWESPWDSSGQLTALEDVNPRGAQMADNLLWLVNRRHPDKKIIVWAATFHIMRNPGTVVMIDTTGERSYAQLVADTGRYYAKSATMGHTVWEQLRDQTYILGFTAYEGKAGMWFTPPERARTIPTPPAGSIEELLSKTTHTNAVVNYRALPRTSWLHEPLVSNPVANNPMLSSWPNVLDGIMFIRTQEPTTRASR